MAFAYLFTLLGRHTKRNPELSVIALTGLVLGFWLLFGMMREAPSVSPVQIWQAQHRFRLSLVFALITVSAALTFSAVRWLFSNVVMRFLAAISYNVYIWHQWIAVKFKEWRIPYWTGENPPNMTGDKVWQWRYTALIVAATRALAVLATYCLEHPMAKRILARKPKKREPMIRLVPREDRQPENGARDENETTFEKEL